MYFYPSCYHRSATLKEEKSTFPVVCVRECVFQRNVGGGASAPLWWQGLGLGLGPPFDGVLGQGPSSGVVADLDGFGGLPGRPRCVPRCVE